MSPVAPGDMDDSLSERWEKGAWTRHIYGTRVHLRIQLEVILMARRATDKPVSRCQSPVAASSRPKRVRLTLDELEPRVAPSSLLGNLPLLGAWGVGHGAGDAGDGTWDESAEADLQPETTNSEETDFRPVFPLTEEGDSAPVEPPLATHASCLRGMLASGLGAGSSPRRTALPVESEVATSTAELPQNSYAFESGATGQLHGNERGDHIRAFEPTPMPQPFADALTQASADPIVVLDLDGPSSTPSDSPRVAQGLGAAGRPVTEDPSLPIGAAGPSGPAAAPVVSGPHVAPFPYAQTFTLHSLPGASKIIYLDFNGHTTPGNTAWGKTYNGGQPIITAPFDMDGNPDAFSEEEQRVIQRVWQRVAEDYAPFELDVTTQDPGDAALARSDESDQNYGTRAVIGPQAANLPGVGGYSYMGVFDSVGDYYKNVFVYSDNLLNREMNLGGAAAHEVGHPFGLNHDGTRGGSEYYEGHGTGAMKWGAIMGAGYDSYVLQWSKGDYYNASNTV
ncbi:MAG: hypothetical protein FJ279_24350, partial [Planctomycetes bacterium]|nr:hypothetical protein [Planctomycetota bacterium]